VAVNLRGTFFMTRNATAIFVKQRSGVVINTASESGTGDYYLSGYAAAKEGVVGFTRGVARDVGRYGVRCNAIRPRAFDTRLSRESGYEKLMTFQRKFGFPMTAFYPMGPIPGKSAEVGEITTWLCTDEAKAANGKIFVAGCGEVAIFDEARPVRGFLSREGWTVDGLSQIGAHLLYGVRNEFLDMPKEALEMIDERAKTHIEQRPNP